MTIVFGAAETVVGGDSDPAAAEEVTVPEFGAVERGQIVALHQTNEGVHPLDIERLGRTGGVLRHAFTPHKQTSGLPLTPVVDLMIFAADPHGGQRKIRGNSGGYDSRRTESSDLAILERTSQPSGVIRTSSSIRMPPQSGR
jgi:hypothetical protein